MLETKEVKSSNAPVSDVEEHKVANAPVSDVEEHKADRPWQGTLLFVLNIIFLIGIVLSTLSAFLVGVLGTWAYADIDPRLGTVSGLFFLSLLSALIPFSILEIFVTIGLFKGKKWAIITMLVFSGLSLIGLFFTFNLFSFVILALFLYLEVTCLVHPFYKSKKI